MKNFTLSANTLSRTVKDNPADRLEVEIGDAKQLDFKPQFKIKRWDNEVNFSMRAEEKAGATMVEEDGKVKYKGKDVEVHQYEKPEAGEDGGFEFEWVLNKKPKSNVLRTTIQHKGLDFFYQPEITDEEAQATSFDGDTRTLEEIKREMRPENVVGSYAVYHKTKRDNGPDKHYKTGKAFHIYRPHAVDADGVKVWCELDITEGELTVTVPEKFLNKASYPVVVDPTFGYTSEGGSNEVSGNRITGSRFTLTEAATIDSITFEISAGVNFVPFPSPQSTKFQAAIYKDSDESLVLESNENTTSEEGISFKTVTVSDNIVLTGSTDYWIVGWTQGGFESNPSFTYDAGSAGDGAFQNSTYVTAGFPDPFSETTESRIYSIYATYTAAAPPSTYNPAFAHRRLLL